MSAEMMPVRACLAISPGADFRREMIGFAAARDRRGSHAGPPDNRSFPLPQRAFLHLGALLRDPDKVVAG